jgi:site-specific DNA recombinase
VLDALRDNLIKPELLREFCAEHLRERNRVRGDERARRDRLRLELTRVERRRRRIVAASADGVPGRPLTDELLALEARQEQLEAERAAAPEAQQPPWHPNRAAIERRKGAALADEALPDEAIELLRSVLGKIVLVPAGAALRLEDPWRAGRDPGAGPERKTGRAPAGGGLFGHGGCGGRI